MKRERRLRIFLLLSPLTVLGATAALQANTSWMRDAWFWLDGRNDSRERAARWHAGFGAVDCGVAEIVTSDPVVNANLARVDGCVLSNFSANKAFRAKYHRPDMVPDAAGQIRAWRPRLGMLMLWHDPLANKRSETRCAEPLPYYEDKPLVNGVLMTHKTMGCG